MIKILNLKLVIYTRISKYENIFAKDYTPNWSGEVFGINKVKKTVRWTPVIDKLNGDDRVEKVIKRKGDKSYVKWKDYDSFFNGWIDKKDIVEMDEYFPESKFLGGRVKIELEFSNYVTKSDFKNATEIDTSSLAKKVDLANLNSDVDKLDIDKLKMFQLI